MAYWLTMKANGINIPVGGSDELDESGNGNDRKRRAGAPAQPKGDATGAIGRPLGNQRMIAECVREAPSNMGAMGQNHCTQGNANQGLDRRAESEREKDRIVLDEKYFRRMDKLDGSRQLYRGRFFDLLVAIGQIDEGLAIEI